MATVEDFVDRRKHARYPYSCELWIAPYTGERFPALEEFVLVQCHDLSVAGISFLLNGFPDFDMFVVRLNGPPGVKYVKAKVRRATLSDDPEHGRYTVGCQLIGMLDSSELLAELESALSL